MMADQIRHVYDVLGLVRVTHAFLPLLRKAAAPSVVNVTRGLGSFTLTPRPGAGSSRSIRSLPTAR